MERKSYRIKQRKQGPSEILISWGLLELLIIIWLDDLFLFATPLEPFDFLASEPLALQYYIPKIRFLQYRLDYVHLHHIFRYVS